MACHCGDPPGPHHRHLSAEARGETLRIRMPEPVAGPCTLGEDLVSVRLGLKTGFHPFAMTALDRIEAYVKASEKALRAASDVVEAHEPGCKQWKDVSKAQCDCSLGVALRLLKP